MNKIKTELGSVYDMISGLSVSGDAVDIVASVRTKLRSIYQSIEAMEKENTNAENEVEVK